MTIVTMTVDMMLLQCANCGMSFCITKDFQDRRRKDHKGFVCPMGHSNVYDAESEEEKMRRERNIAQQQVARMHDELAAKERQLKAEKAAAAKAKKRAGAGVCPCCNRTVGQMARHMKSKHPDFIAAPAG